ncbi:MAG TPA: hypothetical protein VFU51_06650 [Gaiellaceae bacterium]|nr:hypothetical protein [Gaiellaceae bacterium]
MHWTRSVVAGRARSGLVLTVLAALVAASYARLYFGVDFTDEAFYVALPYRFANGARPLVDEALLVQQTSALILYPFVKAYTALAGTDGLVLFARHLHFIFVCAVWAGVSMSLRTTLGGRNAAAAVGATAVTFVPFGIPALSYNTFAEGFFAVGCFLAFAGVGPERRRLLWPAGVCTGLAVFAYPPVAVGAVTLVAAVWVTLRHSRAGGIAALAAPILALGALAFAFFLSDGPGRAVDLVHQSRLYGNQGGGVGKLGTVTSDVLAAFPHKLVACALLVVAAVLRRRTRLAWVPLALLPLTALPSDLRTSASANAFVTNLGLLSLGLVVLEHRRRSAVGIFGLVWVPAAVAGYMTAVSSSNGAVNFALGFFPAAIVALVLLTGAIRSSGADLSSVPVLGTLAITVLLQYASVYRDSGITSLDTRVSSGPYAGLYTTAAKDRFVRRLDADLRQASGPRCSILFYDTFPAGYLFAHGRPETNNTWFLDVDGDQASYDRLLVEYLRDRGLPDVVVRFARVPLAAGESIALSYSASDPLERLFAAGRYDRVVDRPEYVIERRGGSSCRRSRR